MCNDTLGHVVRLDSEVYAFVYEAGCMYSDILCHLLRLDPDVCVYVCVCVCVCLYLVYSEPTTLAYSDPTPSRSQAETRSFSRVCSC